jgi:peptide/nickel transport system substrate-binding protein
MIDRTLARHPARLARLILAGIITATVAAAPAVQVHAAQVHAQAHAAIPNGGTLTYRQADAPDCLDPQKTSEAASDYIMFDLFDGLTSQDSHLNVRPNLATSWSFSHKGTWITFHLRHGVRFSNGDPLSATDVKWTFDRALNPATKSPIGASLLAGVKQVQVLDPYTVRLILSAPNRPLLENLVSGYLGILDQKAVKAAGSKECQYPVGSGPFKITNVGPAFSTVTLSRNPYHNWAPPWAQNQGPAHLDTIVFKAIASDSTTVSELLTGGIDSTFTSGIAPTQFSRVKGNPNLNLVKFAQQDLTYIDFNSKHAPFDTVEGRRAITQAIDRSQIVSIAFQGQAVVTYGPFPPTIPDYDPQVPSYAVKTNVAAAKAYFSAHPVTTPLTFLVYNTPQFLTAAQLIQSQLAAVGVKVNIVPKALPDLQPVAEKGQFDMILFGWTYSDPDILYFIFHSSQEVPGGLNYTFYKNATLDKLLTEGRTTVDPAAAKRIYAQAQRLITTQALIDPISYQLITTGFTKRVHGYVVPAHFPIFFWDQDMYVTS